jgi:hypothetical protein
MNPLEKGYSPQKIVQVKKALSWKPYTLQLVGTGGLKAQQTYAADYDFVSKIEKWDKDSCYDSIQQILDNINDTPDLFFVELKLQNKDGSKIKIHKIEDFNKESYYVSFDPDAIDYAKIDGVVDLNGVFKEVSALYFLSSTPLDNQKYQNELLKDSEDKYKDGKPYKALKRMFMAEKLQGRLGRAVDMALIRHITDFFNSEVGKLYERMNQIDAALIFHDKYSGPMDMRRLDRFITNIGLAGINVLQLPQVSKDYNKIIQREALKFFKLHKLTPGKLPGGVGGGGAFSKSFKHFFGGNIVSTFKRKRGGSIFFHKNPKVPSFLDVAQNTRKMLSGGGLTSSRPKAKAKNTITPRQAIKLYNDTKNFMTKPKMTASLTKWEQIVKPYEGFDKEKKLHLHSKAKDILVEMFHAKKINLNVDRNGNLTVEDVFDDTPLNLNHGQLRHQVVQNNEYD